MKSSSLHELTLSGIFTALLVISALIRIPTPLVPITLQAQVAILAGLLLGPRGGFLCTTLYLFLGLLGLPVFAGGGGIGYVLQPTFGYVIGFCAAAPLAGLLRMRAGRRYLRLLGASLTALATIYLCGMGYYYFIGNFLTSSPIGLWPLFVQFCLLFLPTDLILCALCALLSKRLLPHLSH